MAWMYILECADGSYYVGSTVNLEQRVWQHNEGLAAKYTARRRPVRLVYAAEFESIAEAYGWEKQVQGWNRAKREALIRGDYAALPELAKKDFEAYRARNQNEQAHHNEQKENGWESQCDNSARQGEPKERC